MSDLSSTIDWLKNNYSCSEPVFLSNFYKDNGDRWLYATLQSLYKSEYQNNERLIFVQDCPDVYDYTNLPGRVITQLQKYIAQIDISNFFIIVISGNKSLGQELKQAKELYSTDECNIHHCVVDDLEYQNVTVNQDTFCVLPWIHLYTGPDGNVLPCCVADRQYPMGNVREQSIDAILKSDRFNTLRKNMLNQQRSKECNYCYYKEDSGLPSMRQQYNQKWQVSNPTATIDHFKPVYLDIRLSNICNLKCRMCSSYYSSAIAAEDINIGNINRTPASTNFKNHDSALEEIISYVPAIEQIYFAGGEPLLSAEHYTILQALIDCNNIDLKIGYNTNFTTLKYQNYSVLDLWSKFSNVTISASLDASGEVAEYVRHGTKWIEIEKNLILLKKHCPHVKFIVTSTVGFLNVKSLIFLQQQWHQLGILEIQNFFLNIMITPTHMAVNALPKHHKQRIESIIIQHINWCNESGAISLASQWNDVLNYMWSQDNSHHLEEFRRLTSIMDQYRKESFVETFPEYTDLI